MYRAYVRRLAARGVVGLGFGTEVVRDGIPPVLAEACRDARMPLFEVPYRTPFIAVARAGAEAIAAESYARRSWALAAQKAISLAALRPDGLGATLAELARQLDAWVGMYDAAGTLTREHPSALAPAVAQELGTEVGVVLRRGARAASSLRIDGTPFTLQTLGRGGHLRGVIAMSAGDLDQEGRGVVTAVVAMAGLALEQQQGLDRARTLLRAGLLHSLLGNDPALARRVARDLWGGLPAAPLLVAMTDAAAGRRDAVREWLELRADDRHGGLFFGRGDDGLVLVVSEADAPLLHEFAERFEERLGVSDPVGYDGFATGADQARLARDRTGKGVTRFADVARGGVLSVRPSAEARTVAEAALAPLARYDAEQGTALLETVRVWLENDCSHEATARALGVHRHTVRARVGDSRARAGCRPRLVRGASRDLGGPAPGRVPRMTVNGDVSFWWAQLGGAPASRAALPGSLEVDVCIVGGGYTGLWTAYYLAHAQPDLRIAVLEQRFAGFGASGRNGGWLTNSVTGGREQYVRSHGRDAAIAQQRALNDTVDEVVAVAAREGIDADIVKGGELNVARSPAQLARLRSAASAERAWPATDVVEWDAADIRSRIAVAGAIGGLWHPHAARIHAAKLASGLAAAVERARCADLRGHPRDRDLRPDVRSRTGASSPLRSCCARPRDSPPT